MESHTPATESSDPLLIPRAVDAKTSLDFAILIRRECEVARASIARIEELAEKIAGIQRRKEQAAYFAGRKDKVRRLRSS